jgi:hypothetical protein
LLTTIILLSRDNTLQADLDTTLSHAQVYYALRKLLRSASPVFHITCDGQVLTDANACWLVKTGSVVKIQPGEAPAHLKAQRGVTVIDKNAPPPGVTSAGAAPPVTITSSTPRRVTPDTGARRLEGGWKPKAKEGADFGATRKSGNGRRNLDRRDAPATTVRVPVAGVHSSLRQELASEDLSAWMRSYKSEEDAFSSSALLAETRYNEVVKSTESLGTPNLVRTREVCRLLEAIVMRFGRFRGITRKLLDDVFHSVFEDPNAPNAEPYFLKHSRVQNQLREQRGKNALLDKEVAGVQANSAKRFAFIQRTLANVFNQSMVSAFRKWRTEVQQISAKKEVLRNMTAKARRTISRKALGHWRVCAVLCRLEKAYVVVKEKTDASEQLREKASERERERDAASHEVDVMKNQMQLLQKKLAETEARAVAAETELAKHKAVDDES